MLVHLSNTSPYVCDLNRGPIEQANRMASAPTKKATALLEQKESFPKGTRTPLKLLAPDEVPMDSTATATDIRGSLQPVWYSEQTIVDDHHVQQEDVASIIQEQQQEGRSLRSRTNLTRSTLSPIPSETPSIVEEEDVPKQPSLMHKSSTFTIESSLNDSEKENLIKENPTNPPSDDSFRALEQLLGLGSTTSARGSSKPNRDTLSLTVVTPTDIINSTTTSLRMSYAPKNGSDSLPSSQNIPTMPAIESITSTSPPSFLMNNTTMEGEQLSTVTTTTINQQSSFDLTENDTMKDDTNNDDETNFSFELNDFPNNSKAESMVNTPEPPPPMMAIRAPTCADVAYRALIKPRTGGRVSQPVKADSPLAKPNKLRSSAPTSRMLRSSGRISTGSASQNPINEEQPTPNADSFVDGTNTNTDPQTELVEVVNLPEEDENEQETTTSVTLNLNSPKAIQGINQNASIQSEEYSTPSKPMMPILSREYTYDTPKRRSSQRQRSMLNSSRATPIQQQQQTINEEETNSSMLGVLLTKPTEAVPNVLQKTLTAPSSARTSTRKTTNSPSIASKSMLGVLLTQPTEAEPSPVRTSARKTANSPSIASKSMLNVLLTQPTEAQPSPVRTSTRKTTDSPSIVSKSMLNVLLTQPTEAQPSPVRTSTRKTANSPSIVSKSMLNVLLTQPTEAQPSPVRTSTRKTTNSPSIVSKSMLEVLLTNPTEAVPNALQKTLTVPSPVRKSTRKSERTSSTATPRVSINPLHSSTPSSSRHKSLQIVSIGEQEQVSTIVPQQINNEILQEEQQTQEIEIMPLNDTEQSIQQSSSYAIETGVQTTPSLDVSSRRRLNKLEQQTTPIFQMNKSSSIFIEQKTTTPLQTKVIMNLQRNVRFQLTPDTHERLVAKEKFEENLRGLKPDIIINPKPFIPESKQENVKPVKSVPIKKAAKPKKKAKPIKRLVASKQKKATPKQTKSKQKKPIAKKSHQAQKEKPIPSTKESKKKPKPIKESKKKSKPIKESKKKSKPIKESKKKPEPAKEPKKKLEPTKRAQQKQPILKVVLSAKRAQRKQPTPKVVVSPTKRVQRKQSTPKVVSPTKRAQRKQSIPKVVPPTKRAQRKRPIPKSTAPTKPTQPKQPIPEATAPTKPTQSKQPTPKVAAPIKRESRKRTIPGVTIAPVVKRESRKRTIPEATIEPVVKRESRKRTIPEATIEPVVKRAKISKPVEALPPRPPKTRNASTDNKKMISEPIERQTGTRSHSANKKMTIPEPIMKTEPKNTTPTIRTSKRRLQSVEKNEGIKKKVEEKIQSIPPVQNIELNQEERQKIEALTVAGLKSRLNTHKADIPKNAKKADLIALLINIETNLLKERKQAETATVNTTTKMTTRRRKN